MESGHSTTKLTYADYVLFPDDGLRHEIIDGEHYVTPSPSVRHQQISGRLFHSIQLYLDANPIGMVLFAPLDALLSEFDIVVPDLIYVSHERSGHLTAQNLQGPPDLIVEILSPRTRRRDAGVKRDLYERVGVEEYWLVDPVANTIQVYRRRPDGGFQAPVEYAGTALLTSPLFPGFELQIAHVLA